MGMMVILNGNAKNAAKAEELLNDVQKRARVRTIKYKDIIKATKKIEAFLGISKKALNGTKAVVDLNAQDFPRAYKGSPESTIVELLLDKNSWRIVGIYRDYTKAESQMYVFDLSETAKEAILKKYACIHAAEEWQIKVEH